MIRAPGICEFSLHIFVRCLLQMEEQRPARMPVHSDMLGHAICMCLAFLCSPLGHSLFLLRDLVVTLHRSRAHTSEVCCEATSCASRSHLFRTCLRQAQRAACPAAAGRGDGRRHSDEARTRTHQYSVFSNCSATVTVSPSGPIKLFKGGTTAMSGVLARFPWLLPVRNSFASYGASAVTRTRGRGHVAEVKTPAPHGPRARRRAPRSSEIPLPEECLWVPRTVI